jgi:hypothetical protein
LCGNEATSDRYYVRLAKEPLIKLMEKMQKFVSKDGRYEIFHNEDCTGYVQIAEFQGEAPRREVSRVSFPYEMLAGLMDKLMFATPAPIETVQNQQIVVDLYNEDISENIVYYVD